MQLFNRSPKKNEVAKILDRQDPLNTAKLESSAIARVAATALPGGVLNFPLYILLSLGALAFTALLTVIGATQAQRSFLIVGGGGTFISVIVLLGVLISVSEERKALHAAAMAALDELQGLARHLGSYIETVDKRTNRFFHCVTTSKVTTYYLLNQLDEELEKLTARLSELLAARSRRKLIEAYSLIQGEIVVSDGLRAEAGTRHEIALHNLATVLSDLEARMEAGIAEIESEIFSFRNPPDQK